MDGFSSYHNNDSSGKEQDFHKLAKTVGTSIQKISQNVSSMQRMVHQIGSPQDSQELRQQLHQIQHYTQQLVKDTNTHLRDLANASTGSENRHLRVQRERLTDEFTAALNLFQGTQRRAAEKERDSVRAVREASGLNAPFGLNGSLHSEPLVQLQGPTQKQLHEEIDLQALQEQEQNIRQLENDISDVNQIFKELGALVHEQGDIVDSIEASVERTEVFVSQGATELRQASSLQTKIRKKKLCLALVAAGILTIIAAIIIWNTSS